MSTATSKALVISKMLTDLGFKPNDATEAAEAAQERIDAGTPPLLALVQAVIGDTAELQRAYHTRTGLTASGDRLARRIWDLLSWHDREFADLLKAGPA